MTEAEVREYVDARNWARKTERMVKILSDSIKGKREIYLIVDGVDFDIREHQQLLNALLEVILTANDEAAAYFESL